MGEFSSGTLAQCTKICVAHCHLDRIPASIICRGVTSLHWWWSVTPLHPYRPWTTLLGSYSSSKHYLSHSIHLLHNSTHSFNLLHISWESYITLPPFLKLQVNTLLVSLLSLLWQCWHPKLASLHLPSCGWGHLVGEAISILLSITIWFGSILLLTLLGLSSISIISLSHFLYCGYYGCLWRCEHWNRGLTAASPKIALTFSPFCCV